MGVSTVESPFVPQWRLIVGWMTVVGSVLITSFWAFWGILENFHEGWYHHDLGKNLTMMFGQYLSPMLVFMAVGLLAVRWRWVGVAIHVTAAAFCVWFFWRAHPITLATLYGPLFLLAAGYWFGEPRPRKLAYWLIIGIPLLVVVGLGIEPSIRVASRVDDMDRDARRIAGNGVDLIWAPRGPGWPDPGSASWDEAVDVCRHLSLDGTTVMDTPQDIWRLPTVEEFVRSQHRGNENCGGRWDAESGTPSYQRYPDKESPLWATDSLVIYWWVGTEVDHQQAYKVVFHGMVRPANKSSRFPYWGFRAVREPDQDSAQAD